MGKHEKEVEKLLRAVEQAQGAAKDLNRWLERSADEQRAEAHKVSADQGSLGHSMVGFTKSSIPSLKYTEDAVEKIIVHLRDQVSRIIADETEAKSKEERVASILISIQGLAQKAYQFARTDIGSGYHPIMPKSEVEFLQEKLAELKGVLVQELDLDKAKEKAEKTARKLIKQLLKED